MSSRRAVVGAVIGWLGGALASVSGQQTVWRPVERPPVIRASHLAPGAVIGRPTAAPAVFPPAYRESGPLLPPPAPAAPVGARTIATVPRAGAVIATSGPGQPAAAPNPLDEYALAEQFAAGRGDDRLIERASGTVDLASAVPPAVPSPGPLPEPAKMGNWTGTYPVGVPPVGIPPEAMVEGPAPRAYFGAEYLLWWTKGDQAPPLVTTGSRDAAIPGALGNADTVVLQDGSLNHGTRSGGRFTAGYFLDDCAGKAIEVSGFFLGSRSVNFNAGSATGNGVISRPFFLVNGGIEAVQQVAFPGEFNGQVYVNAPSSLWGLEANFLCPWCCGCDWRVNWLVGPRYLNLSESVTIREDIQFIQDVPPPPDAPTFLAGDRYVVTDRFAVRNQFYGAQLGAEGRWMRDRFTIDGRAKLALGVTDQQLEINGNQTLRRNGTTMNFAGGLYALSSNIGRFRQSRFAVVPEVGISAGYYVTDSIRLSVGYNVLYWSSVIRPGQQIDRNLNGNLIPNFDLVGVPPSQAARPAVLFKTTDYWAQGITFGMEIQF